MKLILIVFISALFFTSCKNGDLDTEKEVVVTDTTKIFNNNTSSDTAVSSSAAVTPAQPEVKTTTRTIYVDRPSKTAARKRTVRQQLGFIGV